MTACSVFRVAAAIAWALAAVFYLAAVQATQAAEPPWKIVLDQADFVLSEERRPPGDSAAWQPVSLPDQWRHRMPAGTEGQGWYRIRVAVAQSPASVHAIHIPHTRALRTDFFVNGRLVGGGTDLIALPRDGRGNIGPAFETSLNLTVPPGLLSLGENFIHVRARATSDSTYLHGLPRVTFGEATALHNTRDSSNDLSFGAQRVFYTMALVSGVITFFLWLARREDKVMFWYSVACLTWGLISVPRLALRWEDSFAPLVSVLGWFLRYGLVVPVVILCLRTVNFRWRLFETALWGFLVIEATFPLWAPGGGAGRLAWDAANAVLLLTGVAIVVFHANRPLRWSVHLQIAALLLMAGLMFFEVARYLGWVYVDFKSIRHYHVPLMLIAIGALIFERHVFAVRRTEQANLELERRVAEKAREIEANYARIENAMRERTLAGERQRILADMHDGLGASLIALLRQVQSGGVDRTSLERRIQEALQEMRVAVDALQPHEGDLASVLGSLRYRLDGMIRATGIRLVWEVGELPRTAGLGPSTVFALQRILLEAITNVLKHSGARRISLTARAQGKDGIEIKVEDDGRGFDLLHPAAGLGLTNMRTRAARIGAALEIRSRSGEGTIVELALPATLPGAAAPSVSERQEIHTPQGLVPAAGGAG